MTGRARRNGKRMAAALQAQQQQQRGDVLAVLPADLIPAAVSHEALPPLDMAALAAPITLSPNLAQPAYPPRTPPAMQRQHTPPPPREPYQPRRQQQPAAQPTTLSDHQYVSLRLLEALIRRDGEDALSDGAVGACIRAAKRILKG